MSVSILSITDLNKTSENNFTLKKERIKMKYAEINIIIFCNKLDQIIQNGLIKILYFLLVFF